MVLFLAACYLASLQVSIYNCSWSEIRAESEKPSILANKAWPLLVQAI